MTLIKNTEVVFSLNNAEGFEMLIIKVGEYQGMYYYGFVYSHNTIGASAVNAHTEGKALNSKHAAFLAAIKNIEAHFNAGFVLKCAYVEYNRMTQLCIS